MITLSYRIDREHGPENIYKMTKFDFPGKTEEFYQLISQERWKESVRFCYQMFIRDKLMKNGFYSCYHADKRSERIMKDLPEELFPNVEEWLNDEPISEIKYGDLSIKELMDFGKNRNGGQNGFLECIELMVLYIKEGCKNKDSCYHALCEGD